MGLFILNELVNIKNNKKEQKTNKKGRMAFGQTVKLFCSFSFRITLNIR